MHMCASACLHMKDGVCMCVHACERANVRVYVCVYVHVFVYEYMSRNLSLLPVLGNSHDKVDSRSRTLK
jgi:hypothetical protein